MRRYPNIARCLETVDAGVDVSETAASIFVDTFRHWTLEKLADDPNLFFDEAFVRKRVHDQAIAAVEHLFD